MKKTKSDLDINLELLFDERFLNAIKKIYVKKRAQYTLFWGDADLRFLVKRVLDEAKEAAEIPMLSSDARIFSRRFAHLEKEVLHTALCCYYVYHRLQSLKLSESEKNKLKTERIRSV